MGFEIDFLPVGNGEKCGDAIALRFGNLFGHRDEQYIVTIDGGFRESGELLIEHLNKYYNTSRIDLAISTHPDNDHVCGVEVLLEKLVVKRLWMHLPWNHTENIANMFQDGRVTDNSVSESLRESLETAYRIEKLARNNAIPIDEPFSGLKDISGLITVLGPSESFFEKQLPYFRGTPVPKSASLVEQAKYAVKEIIQKVAESFSLETLDDDGETSAENNTSTILLITYGKDRLLFTGDAGIPALTDAADFFEAGGDSFSNVNFFQIPHHGSKRNVGPTILDRIIGPKQYQDNPSKTAFISVTKDGKPKHPAKKVVNAFRRRGVAVYVTEGQSIRHSDNAPQRDGWVNLVPLPFYSEVEE